jgi:site-specific DNA-methyltransferase (adenine-specific)
MNIDTKVYRKHENPTFGNTLLGAVPLVSEVYLMDNIELMKHYPDKYFDLAVVDPPYGIGANKMTLGNGKEKVYRGENDWDNQPPPLEYFYELFRVSKNQIVWGANHFISRMPYDSSCWIFWDKGTGSNDFADGELAWTSFDKTVKKYFKSWVGANAKDGLKRIHPTQKPISLYDWIYQNYATEGMRILDTHLGSGGSRIAANKMKMNFVGCETDERFFNEQNKRYEEFVSQSRLF